MVNGGKKFKLVLEEGQSLSFKVPKDTRGKQKLATFDITEEYDVPEEQEPACYTLSSVLFECPTSFSTLRALLSFVVTRGFSCDIFKDGKILGTWNPVSGYVEY